jgi:hypothetical protein
MEAKAKIIKLISTLFYIFSFCFCLVGVVLWSANGLYFKTNSLYLLAGAVPTALNGFLLSLIVDIVEAIDNIERGQIKLNRKVDQLLENARNSE